MSGFTLKLLALFLMIVDHCGLVLFAGTSLYLPCRILGRIAFPLYAFLITEGYVHTRSVKKYAGRLLVFAVLSEVPFDYAFFGTPFYMGYQNVFFTLVLGLGALACIDGARGRSGRIKASETAAGNTGKSELPAGASTPLVGAEVSAETPELSAGELWEQTMRKSNISKILLIVIMVIAELTYTDYGAFGVLVIVLFYLFRNQKVKCMVSVAAALIIYGFLGGFYIEGFGAIALIFILLYNGEKGQYPFPSLLFYAAYPLHLLILGLM
ncbi:MAG: conjugal transfer protein TraX [Lachnospiraceae bacterium]|nr:conjugal transfer protein TraX [Lachnospiraceae bacterium]